MTEPGAGTDDADRVRRLLAAAPGPEMPTDVAQRLDAVLAAESRRRSEIQRAKQGFDGPGRDRGVDDPGRDRGVDDTERDVAVGTGLPGSILPRPPRPLLVTEPPAAGRRWRHPAAVALVVAVTTAAVGVAGYTLSATAGLNEPVSGTTLRLQSSELAQQAEAIVAGRNLSAHTFSLAWRCAREVTDGRITGLTRAVVDGNPSLLVYTRTSGENWVTVVSGCPGPQAQARETVRLP